MRRLLVILGVVAIFIIAYFIIDWFGILEEEIPPTPYNPPAVAPTEKPTETPVITPVNVIISISTIPIFRLC